MSDAPAVQLKVISSLAAVAAEDWDACANPDSQIYNPFLRHAFLLALGRKRLGGFRNRLARSAFGAGRR